MKKVEERKIQGDILGDKVEATGSLVVKGSVLSRSIVEARSQIYISGNVEDSRISSMEGDVEVSGSVVGKDGAVFASGDVRVGLVDSSSIDSNGSVFIQNSSLNGRIRARNSVTVGSAAGRVEGGVVEAGLEIRTGNLGSRQNASTRVFLRNLRQQEIFELYILYERNIREKDKKLSHLAKVIELIRLLGERVVSLPREKKETLATQVKEYKKLKEEITTAHKERERILTENQELSKYNRVVYVENSVYPGVRVEIDKLSLEVKYTYSHVVFYKSGMIIMGDLDKYIHRKG